MRAPTRHLYVFKDETVGPVDSTPDEHTSRASSPSRRSSLKISIFQRHIPFLQAVSGSGVHLQQTGTIRDALLRPLWRIRKQDDQVQSDHRWKNVRSEVYEQRFDLHQLEPLLHRVPGKGAESLSGHHLLRQHRTGVGFHISGKYSGNDVKTELDGCFINVGRILRPNIITSWPYFGIYEANLLQVISLEGWTDIMYYVQDAHSFWDWIYFVLLIVVSGRACR